MFLLDSVKARLCCENAFSGQLSNDHTHTHSTSCPLFPPKKFF